jgi:hypothetical protein
MTDYPSLPPLPPESRGTQYGDYRDWMQPSPGPAPDAPSPGVSSAQPGVTPPSFTPNPNPGHSQTIAFPAPRNVQVQPQAKPQARDYGSPYPRRLIPSDDMPDIPVKPQSPDLSARHDAYIRAQDILNPRHYETQGERLDAEIRLAEWLLGE